MNWGIERKMAELPNREKKEIQLFDLKKYVSEEKRKRMLEDMEKNKDNPQTPGLGFSGMDNPMSSSNPFLKSMGNAPNPFANPLSGNPLASNPFMKNAPMTNEEIDKMIADIDKKLKELDEEEARQKELEKQQTSKVENEVKQINSANKMITEEPKIKIENKKQSKEETKVEDKIPDKPKINIDVDSVIVNDNVITDDEFFDDFFTDD